MVEPPDGIERRGGRGAGRVARRAIEQGSERLVAQGASPRDAPERVRRLFDVVVPRGRAEDPRQRPLGQRAAAAPDRAEDRPLCVLDLAPARLCRRARVANGERRRARRERPHVGVLAPLARPAQTVRGPGHDLRVLVREPTQQGRLGGRVRDRVRDAREGSRRAAPHDRVGGALPGLLDIGGAALVLGALDGRQRRSRRSSASGRARTRRRRVGPAVARAPPGGAVVRAARGRAEARQQDRRGEGGPPPGPPHAVVPPARSSRAAPHSWTARTQRVTEGTTGPGPGAAPRRPLPCGTAGRHAPCASRRSRGSRAARRGDRGAARSSCAFPRVVRAQRSRRIASRGTPPRTRSSRIASASSTPFQVRPPVTTTGPPSRHEPPPGHVDAPAERAPQPPVGRPERTAPEHDQEPCACRGRDRSHSGQTGPALARRRHPDTLTRDPVRRQRLRPPDGC